MKEIKLLIQFVKPYKGQLSISFICHVLMALFTIISIPLIIPFFHFLFSTTPELAIKPTGYTDLIGWLEYYFVLLIQAHGPNKALLLTCLFLIGTFFLKNLFRYLAVYFIIPIRGGIVRDLRNKLYGTYLDLNYESRNNFRKGDLLTRITVDAQEVEWSMLRFIQTIFKAPIIIIGSIFLMLSIHKGLTLFVFVLMLFTVLVIGTLSKSLKRNSSKMQASLATLNSRVDESIQGSLMLKIYRVTQRWKAQFESVNNYHRDIFQTVTRRQELSSPLSEFLGVTVVIILLWYGSHQVFENSLRPEAFFTFVFAFYHVIEPLKSFSSAYYNIKKGSASLDRIQNFMDEHQHEIQESGMAFNFEKEISFENVSFAYGKNQVLKEVSFTISKGEKVAFVGNSGAGKSTIISLLLNIIEPSSGTITFDGVSMNQIDLSSLYGSTALVSQNPFLFNDTIRENITLGRSEINDSTIFNCLDIANAHFVSRTDKGLDTVIGDEGNKLSGGEKQRLTIARALIENPDLLIMDEPTSALDPSSEQKVSAAIAKAMEDRTAIIIAHKLSTIKHVDRIFVLNEGELIERGSHEELIQEGGFYSHYVNLQTRE